MVVIDTSIVIDHLRQKTKIRSYLVKLVEKHPKNELAISVLSVQELYEGRSTRDVNQEKILLATISPLRILPYNYETAKMAGEIARDLAETIQFADAAIAATAIVNGGQLATLNKKDFQKIRDLDFFNF
ncbi:MAG: PIN domain-containing protein [Candidatus Shapirobacteria bacterium]